MEYNLQVQRVVSAPISKVWEALTQVDQLKQWFCPESMTVPTLEGDIKVGKNFRLVMKAPNGDQHPAVGEYKLLEKPHKVVMTWQWEGDAMGDGDTVLTIELKEVDQNQTEITLQHEGFSSEQSKQEHTKGWTSTLDHLKKYLE